MKERLKNNIAILKQHNLTHEPVYHITDGKLYEIDLINEIVEDCEEIFKDEEQGLIVRLPCKVGDNVYIPYPSFNEIEEWQVVSFHICENIVLRLRNFKNEHIALDIKDLGKEWFFTRAEAEKKLKELKGEEK